MERVTRSSRWLASIITGTTSKPDPFPVPSDPREQAVYPPDDDARLVGFEILRTLHDIFGHAQIHRWDVSIAAGDGVQVCTEFKVDRQ